MSLTKKDKEWIEKTIIKNVSDLLTVEIKYEKKEDEKTGQPLAVPELIVEKEYMPIWWAKYLPRWLAAIRGMQETLDKHDAQILKLLPLVDGNNKISEETLKRIDQIGMGMIPLIDLLEHLDKTTKQLNGTINKQGVFEVMERMYQERLNNLVITMLAIGEKDD